MSSSRKRGSVSLRMDVRSALAAVFCLLTLRPGYSATPSDRELVYTNIIDRGGPWSVQAVKFPIRHPVFELRSVHAGGRAIGLRELSVQTTSVQSTNVEPIAAVNGDFYQRHGAHAGDPRGLQIVDGELISAPVGSACFWIDLVGEPHLANVESEFKVIWPDGSFAPFGLNGNREADEIQLYTPAIGRTTRTERGREIVLEHEGTGPWLPLRAGRTYKARVRSVRDGANSPVAADTMVLSVGPVLVREVPRLSAGAVLTISTATSPDLRGARMALSGGPILVLEGKPPRSRFGLWGGDETASGSRRHPRSAIGWGAGAFWLVQVDGRQRHSRGMTLPELSEFLVDLGCTEAMNLDGGGSATFWYKGRIRNSPCDGEEREIANSLVVVKKSVPSAATPQAQQGAE